MAAGRLLISAALALAATLALPSVLTADDANRTEPKRQFLGEVNASSVFVHSASSEEAYATMKLKKGTQVTVVGVKGNWLQIVPPEGSFAYVPKMFVILRGDGTVGRTNKEVIARAGSELNDLAARPLVTVADGEDVQVIGQYHEYFKIKPPQGSYLWVNKQFVDPLPVQPGPADAQSGKPSTESPALPPDEQGPDSGPGSRQPGTRQVADRNATTQPSQEVADNTDAQPATTQPAFDAVAEYDRLEADFKETAGKPIAEQPLPELIASYQKLLESDDLPVSMRQIAQAHASTLKIRNDARNKFLAFRAERQKEAEKQKSLVAERQEIEERLKANGLDIFAAVGTLRTSSLQVGQATLYRLTDPASGRTVAYIRASDPKYSGFIGQFVGVRGKITSDGQLKSMIENPVELKAVDQAQVNIKIAAQIVPPSLVRLVPASKSPAPARDTGTARDNSRSSDDQASTNTPEPQ